MSSDWIHPEDPTFPYRRPKPKRPKRKPKPTPPAPTEEELRQKEEEYLRRTQQRELSDLDHQIEVTQRKTKIEEYNRTIRALKEPPAAPSTTPLDPIQAAFDDELQKAVNEKLAGLRSQSKESAEVITDAIKKAYAIYQNVTMLEHEKYARIMESVIKVYKVDAAIFPAAIQELMMRVETTRSNNYQQPEEETIQ